MSTTPSQPAVRVGIIGCGQIARFHYEGYERAGASIVHACDLRDETAAAVANRYGCRASTDYRAVLDDPAVDLVSILTSASSHREICLAAMAAGKGVVCEKTLSDQPASSAEIARRADQTGSFFATAYMKRFFPALQQAKALLAQMGPIISIHARSWQPWDLWQAPLPDSFTTHPSPMLRNYGGGVLVCAGSHILDLLHWLAGRPVQAFAQMRSRPGLDFDILANAMLTYADGAVAHLECCWHPLQFAGHERNGWDERLEINTVDGRLDIATVMWNKPTNNGALLVHQDAATGRTVEHRFPAVNPFDLEMAEMLRRFRANEPAQPSAWDGYVVDELIATISKSAATNQVQPLNWLA